MMKKFSLFLFALVFTGLLVSCKKCIECVRSSTGFTTSLENCDSKKDRKDFEQSWENTCAAAKIVDPTTTCECKEK